MELRLLLDVLHHSNNWVLGYSCCPLQLQFCSHNPNTKDVTAEMELRGLSGTEMRELVWRGWAELVHQMRYNSKPGSTYHNHYEELWPELTGSTEPACVRPGPLEGMVSKYHGLLM